MKNIMLICLLIAFTSCTGNQIRILSKTKKIASCCTSMSMQKKEALATALVVKQEEMEGKSYKNSSMPSTVSLLEWSEIVHIW